MVTMIFTGAVTNATIIPKPVYLDSAPPKSSLPSIQPFKRHVHIPKHSHDHHMTSHLDSTDGDSHSDGVPVVMRGTLIKVCFRFTQVNGRYAVE